MACNIADGVTHRRSWLITRFSLSGCARDWWRCGRVRRDRRSALEVLRIPLEDGEIRLARRDGLARYPARFQLVLVSNLCPCAPADPRHCICAPVAELTSEPRWAFGAGVGDGNASVLSRASMVDEPSTLKIELIYWPATTFAARAEAQAALFRYIDGWQKPRRIQQGLVGRSPDEYEAAWQARQRQPARLPSNARTPKSPARKENPGN